MNKEIAVVGHGWVGKSMTRLFPDAYVYTRKIGVRAAVNRADIAFICVPSPVVDEGRLDTSGIESIISWITTPLIVIRSTVNPGDTDRWTEKYNKRIVMQPEYLGETPDHPLLNEQNTQFMILGGKTEDVRELIELYQTVYNANTKIRKVSALEAEVIKLSENRAIGFKVAQAQELYDVCEAAGIDYYTIRDSVYGDDPRFNLWWTYVYPNKRGFNSKCIPKDIYAWAAWAESVGYNPELTRGMLERNKKWING
jgi:UDPglucose 6-dehydrogenase